MYFPPYENNMPILLKQNCRQRKLKQDEIWLKRASVLVLPWNIDEAQLFVVASDLFWWPSNAASKRDQWYKTCQTHLTDSWGESKGKR